ARPGRDGDLHRARAVLRAVSGGGPCAGRGPIVTAGWAGRALSLPGGGLTGSLYQIGALAAFEDRVRDVSDGGPPCFSLYVGSGSGATVAASVAGGVPVQRIYRALLDPADNFFPLDRRHLVRFDLVEWQRTLTTAAVALRHALARIATRKRAS